MTSRWAFIACGPRHVCPGGFVAIVAPPPSLLVRVTETGDDADASFTGPGLTPWNTAFWSGLVNWFRDALLAEGVISPGDVDLFVVVDTAQQVVDAIFRYYEQRGIEPGAPDRAPILDL